MTNELIPIKPYSQLQDKYDINVFLMFFEIAKDAKDDVYFLLNLI